MPGGCDASQKSADPGHSIGARISRAGEEFVIGTDRPLDINGFLLRLNDDEYRLLDKLDKVTDCIFCADRQILRLV